MTTRRKALLALPLACAAIPPGLAQAPKDGPVKRVGILALGTEPPVPPAERPLYIALKQKGWILGENLQREPAYTSDEERLPALAEALVRQRVDLILSLGDSATVAAARATQTIPIVFSYVLFPLEVGLVDSLARPGRNVTGQSLIAGTDIAVKRMAFLKEIAPGVKRLAYLVPGVLQAFLTVSGGRFSIVDAFAAGARSLGMEMRFQPLLSAEDLGAAFGEMLAWRAQAVMAGLGWHQAVPQQMADLLLRHRLPSAFLTRDMVDAGGLLSYGVGKSEAGYADVRLADYVDRVLRGAPPATLPVEQPRRYELVINLQTAKALGLTVPPALRIQADELIE